MQAVGSDPAAGAPLATGSLRTQEPSLVPRGRRARPPGLPPWPTANGRGPRPPRQARRRSRPPRGRSLFEGQVGAQHRRNAARHSGPAGDGEQAVSAQRLVSGGTALATDRSAFARTAGRDSAATRHRSTRRRRRSRRFLPVVRPRRAAPLARPRFAAPVVVRVRGSPATATAAREHGGQQCGGHDTPRLSSI